MREEKTDDTKKKEVACDEENGKRKQRNMIMP